MLKDLFKLCLPKFFVFFFSKKGDGDQNEGCDLQNEKGSEEIHTGMSFHFFFFFSEDRIY